MKFLASQFSGKYRVTTVQPLGQDMGTAFRADAKAEGQLVVVGGWECARGVTASRARWFSLQLDRRNAPWAFSRGEPYRTIAALELFASLLCIVVFGKAWPPMARGALAVTGITDNLGNSFILARMMTAKFPSVVILTELAMQLRARALELRLDWVPRDQNDEADALTNQDFGAFDEARRVEVDLAAVEWIALPAMLGASEAIYAEVKARREGRPSAPGPARPAAGARRRPEDKLRA